MTSCCHCGLEPQSRRHGKPRQNRAMPNQPSLKPRDLAAILLVVVIWGLNFVAMKIGLAYFTPFQLGAGRFVFAFLPAALLTRPPRVRPRWPLAFGLAQGVGQFGFLFVALQVGMTAALASVLMQTQVFFTAAFGVLLLGERIDAPLKAGIAIAALGLACFGVNVWLTQGAGGVTGLGLLLNLASAAMWAASNIVVRKAQQDSRGFNPLAFVVWSSGVAIAPFAVLSWVFDPPSAQANWSHAAWPGWAALAVLGWVATTLAYGVWTGLLKRFPASRVAPFSLAVPVVGMTAGVVLLHETIAPLQWVGAVFVLGALACVLFGDRLFGRR
jgi:O-acetylserine/cysteine efflux transporter